MAEESEPRSNATIVDGSRMAFRIANELLAEPMLKNMGIVQHFAANHWSQVDIPHCKPRTTPWNSLTRSDENSESRSQHSEADQWAMKARTRRKDTGCCRGIVVLLMCR